MIFKCGFCRKEFFDLSVGDTAKCSGQPRKDKDDQIIMPSSYVVVSGDDGPRLEVIG